MNWEAVHVVIDGIALLASIFAFINSQEARRISAAEDLRARIVALEANGEHALSAGDVKTLSDEIHELRGELRTTVRTVERMNQFLMERGGT